MFDILGLMFEQDDSLWSKITFSPLIVITIILISLGCVFSGLGVYYLILYSNQPVESCLSQIEKTDQFTQLDPLILVDVSGVVEKPGLYQIDPAQRLAGAINQAGGISEQADRAYLAQKINLASPVEDGDKIYIPFQGEITNVDKENDNSSLDNKISINSADQAQLETLPGVGEVKALKIISSRPFSSIDELVELKILSENQFNQIKGGIEL